MKPRATRKRLLALVAVLAVAFVLADIYSYYFFYPQVFQVQADFSTNAISINEPFVDSVTVTNSLILRTLEPTDTFDVTIVATAGWIATRLVVYNVSAQTYPIVDNVLFEASGLVSLSFLEPNMFLIGPLNFSASVLTSGADRVIFNPESLLMQNLTFARMPFSRGNATVELQVSGGNVSVSHGPSSFDLDNHNGTAGIHLEMQVTVGTQITATGNFTAETATYSSTRIDFASPDTDAFFKASNGFLTNNGNRIQVLEGSDLNITNFTGEINSFGIQTPHEVSIDGYAEKIQAGETDVTGPNPLRDLIVTLTPYSALILILIVSIPSTYLGVHLGRTVKKEEK
jgi:hypothetical protein